MQVGSIPKGIPTGDSLIEKADNDGQKLSTKSVEASSPSSLMNGSIHMKTLDCKPHRKLKKKHMKCRIRHMHLFSTNLFRASLSLKKKKKKKHRRSSSIVKNHIQEHLLEAGCSSIFEGPSTSDKTQTISVGSTNRWEKRVKHGNKKGDKRAVGKNVKISNSECVMDTIDVEEFKDRIGLEGAMLATDKEPPKSSDSVAKQWDAQRSDSLNDNNSNRMQKLMSILTRGLSETIGK